MGDILIPVGVLAIIGFLVYAIVVVGRRQREATRAVFQAFAERAGLEYLAIDDGTAREFARDMDGIGQFISPSLGTLIPEDVVSGEFEGARVVAFRHMTRIAEDETREWLVAGVEAPETISVRSMVEFKEPKASARSSYLEDPIAKERQAAGFHLVVRSPTPGDAGPLMHDGRLDSLADRASSLPFRPELQIRGNRLAAYPASRNASLDGVDQLVALMQFALEAVKIASG